MNNVFIARQPVYNRKLEVIGYELLFRDSSGDQTGIEDSELATSQVVLNLLLDIGLQQIVGEKLAFLNVSRNFLLSNIVSRLDSNKIVLEVSEDIEPDEEILGALSRLSDEGYKITLDNFVYHYSKDELIKYADYIKFDAKAFEQGELKSQVSLLRDALQDKKAVVIASKIETQNDFEDANALDVEYFQGYYLAHPNIIRGSRLSANRHSVLELQKILHEQHISNEDIVELISRDFFLTYRVLNYIQEHYKQHEQVTSVSKAVEMVGLEEIRTWIDLLAMSKLDDRPNELLVSALARGKMCELMAIATNKDNPGAYYLVGLFSHIDAIMEKNLSDMLDSLPLNKQINTALLYRKGAMGDALNCVIAYERGDWDAVYFERAEKSLIIDSYLKAIEWASDLNAELIAC